MFSKKAFAPLFITLVLFLICVTYSPSSKTTKYGILGITEGEALVFEDETPNCERIGNNEGMSRETCTIKMERGGFLSIDSIQVNDSVNENVKEFRQSDWDAWNNTGNMYTYDLPKWEDRAAENSEDDETGEDDTEHTSGKRRKKEKEQEFESFYEEYYLIDVLTIGGIAIILIIIYLRWRKKKYGQGPKEE